MNAGVSFALALLVSSVAVAQTSPVPNALNKPPQPIGQKPAENPAPNKPPVEIDSKPKFSVLKAAWEQGAPTSVEFLRGKWIAVAQVTNVECGFAVKDQWNPSGLKNPDGSENGTLVFDDYISNAITGEKIFGVQLLGLGSKKYNQGPYAVDPNEPQFSQFAYSTAESKTVYFANFCRSLPGPDYRMVCAGRLNVINATPNNLQRRCIESGHGLMDAFKKVL